MGMESGIARAAMVLLAALALEGGLPQAGNVGNADDVGEESGAVGESGAGAGADAAGEVIDIYEETGIGLEPEQELELKLLDVTYREQNLSGYYQYSVTWSPEPVHYEEMSGFRVNVGLPLAERTYIATWDEESGSYTAYFAPEGVSETPYEIPDSLWENADEEAADGKNSVGEEIGGAYAQDQNAPVSLRDLNRYLLERLFIQLNDQNAGECRGEYRILDYSVTNRYWTDDVIGTDVVFHVVPKAERVEDLEYFQGILACVGLTDMEGIKELFADLEVPGEDEWRFVAHPELAADGGSIPYTSEPSPRMAAVIEELSGMLTEKGYTSEEAERIADTLMYRYYVLCAKWLAEEREYSFCFRTELDADGNPVSISTCSNGGVKWNPYAPQLRTKEEQQESYFQAGRDEMAGMMNVMF